MKVLNKETNPVFNNAIAHYFLAYNDGKIVGRIAALINWIEVKDLNKKKVRFGWFDFIDFFHVDECALISGVFRVIFWCNIIDETAPILSSSSAAPRKALG